ncbi:MAG: hypothetical protein KAH57_09215, partial [Thermoplasmata archaeon]|nr:hypothetical protein [Thermoplasmata archaeon]
NISMNGSTGMLEWTATRSIFLEQDHTLDLMMKVTDGEETISRPFHLDLILDPSPTTALIAPIDKITVGNITTIRWGGMDEGEEPLTYDVYLGQLRSNVISLSGSAKIAENINETEFILVDLEVGKTYYWTVIPHDQYSSGTCIDEAFSFFVNVPPVTELIYPEDEEIVPYGDLVLEFEGRDLNMDTLQYHLYISTAREDVETFAVSAHDTTGPSFKVEDLQPGATYYWTVIANDDHSYGTCIDGIHSFTVNVPPAIDAVLDQQGYVGSEIAVDVNGTDPDADESNAMEFSILEGPEGMTIVSVTGVISWTPVEADIGAHTIKVQLSDGLDTVDLSFQIEVLEAVGEEDDDDKASSAPLIIAGIALLALLIAAVVIFLIIKKRSNDEEGEEQKEDTLPQEQIPDLGVGPSQVGEPTIQQEIPPDPLVSGFREGPVPPPQEPAPVPQPEPPSPTEAPPEPAAPPVPEQPEAPLTESSQPEPPAPPEPAPVLQPETPAQPDPVQTGTQPVAIQPEVDEVTPPQEPAANQQTNSIDGSV